MDQAPLPGPRWRSQQPVPFLLGVAELCQYLYRLSPENGNPRAQSLCNSGQEHILNAHPSIFKGLFSRSGSYKICRPMGPLGQIFPSEVWDRIFPVIHTAFPFTTLTCVAQLEEQFKQDVNTQFSSSASVVLFFGMEAALAPADLIP